MAGISPAVMTGLNMAGWWFLPDIVTQRCLVFFHSFLRSRGRSTPQQGTIAYVTHYRRMYATVIFAYLLYSLVDSVSRMPPNLYESLGVSRHATDAELKTAFRYFAKRYHPDRVGAGGEALFISVRDAYDSLRDPVKRFAYDRFGREALSWKDTSMIDFLYSGAKSQIGFYIVTLFVLVVFSFIQKQSSATFWRYLLLFATFTIELQLILAPQLLSLPLSHLSFIFPNQVTYQHILFLHQIYVSTSIALTRVFPVLFAGDPVESSDPRVISGLIERLTEVLRATDATVSTMLLRDLEALKLPSPEAEPAAKPTIGLDDETYSIIGEELESAVIAKMLHEHPAMKASWDTAITRVRERRKEREERKVEEEPEEPPLANGSANHHSKDFSPGTTPSVQGNTFRFLSPESDDGKDNRPRSKRERSPSP